MVIKKTILSATYRMNVIEKNSTYKKEAPFKTLKLIAKRILTKPKTKMIFTTTNGCLYAKLHTDMRLHWTAGTVSKGIFRVQTTVLGLLTSQY